MISNSNFIKNTNAIRSALNLDWDDYVESFGMTQKEAKKYLFNSKEFPLRLAMNFCERFELDLESAFSDHFDAKVLARNYLKETPTLPDHYQFEKNSRAQTLINFITGLNDQGLEWLNELILRRLQVPKTILLYPEMDVPFKLITDYLSLVEKFSKNLDFMRSAGQKGIINLNKRFNLVQPGITLTVDFYDEFFTDKIKQFDKTYNYRFISHKGKELILECELTEEFKDLYQIKNIYSEAFLQYKSGICDGLSTLLGNDLGYTQIIKNKKTENDYFLIRPPEPLSTSPCYLH